MRLSVALGCLLVAGCAGPHSSGALWAQQNLEAESAGYRLSEAQRSAVARGFELALADETLAADRARVEASLQACPGADRQPLEVSTGDRERDSVRLRAQGDQPRLAGLAQVALADWRARRARATGEAHFCDDARQALLGRVNAGGTAGAGALAGLGSAMVTRDARHGLLADPSWPVNMTVSSYGLGYVDTVQANAPLPQYLAAVYGGEVQGTAARLDGQAPEVLVDALAPDAPEWEPDALYAALAFGHT